MHGDSLEIDELVVRFQVRRRYLYLWVAVSRLTRQVISFFLGDRSIGSLHALWQRVPREYRRKLIYTDACAVEFISIKPLVATVSTARESYATHSRLP
jgi:IS1 family transposase